MPSRLSRLFLFALTAFSFLTARAVDVKRFELLKGIHYYQIGEGVAYLQTNNMYRFTAQVYADVVGDVLGASVLTSGSQNLKLLADPDGDPFRFRDKFDNAFGLENNFPDGTYNFTIVGLHDNSHTMTLAINGGSYPAAPILNNYAA